MSISGSVFFTAEKEEAYISNTLMATQR